MFVIIFKQHGALNCEQRIFGPFDSYLDAEDALSNGSVPTLHGAEGHDSLCERNGYRYIHELEWVNGCVL